MRYRIALAVLIALPLLPGLAPAQSASPSQETQLQLEMKRKRLVVRPETRTDLAVRDAEQAAEPAAAAAIARDASAPSRRQLDYDVTSAIQARSLRGARR
ncbi:MAG TPA: hypothetical protein VFL90_20900 [Methylomirabilota bacterium]|nr:hypothetical protein [Methylomirabilota bacterium]